MPAPCWNCSSMNGSRPAVCGSSQAPRRRPRSAPHSDRLPSSGHEDRAMTDTALQKSYRTQWLITLLLLAVVTLAGVTLLLYFWEDIKAIAPLYDLIKIIAILLPLLLGV